jgi:hypothetical protein
VALFPEQFAGCGQKNALVTEGNGPATMNRFRMPLAAAIR